MSRREDGIFPDEVVMQILSRLPVKSLFKSKTVCKLWYRLSSDKYFLQLYNEVSAKNPMILVDITDSSESKSSLICVDNLRGVSEFSLDFLNDRVKVRASCNGLLCCSSIPEKGVYYVCNPVTREFRLLPKSRKRSMTWFSLNNVESTLVGLACDFTSQQFKVVLAYHGTFNRRVGNFLCLVFDSELNKWGKIISFQDDHFSHMNKNQVAYVNGALHWLTDSSTHILVLDLGCGIWSKKALPSEVSNGMGNNRVHLLEFDGCLSVIQFSSEKWMDTWVLEDYWKDEWVMADR